MLIQQYQKSWVNDFSNIKKVIEGELLNLDIMIEHVGITAVKHLAAKPIIAKIGNKK
jgi:GrpB-like predicted nucleotidyltransferase (UPF0157 family)